MGRITTPEELLGLPLVLVSHRAATWISVLRLLNWDSPPMLPEVD
jgi:hypothetical protein